MNYDNNWPNSLLHWRTQTTCTKKQTQINLSLFCLLCSVAKINQCRIKNVIHVSAGPEEGVQSFQLLLGGDEAGGQHTGEVGL